MRDSTAPTTDSLTQEERLRVAQTARALETSPLGPEAEQQRRRLKSWVDEAPDFTLPVIPELLASLENATTNRAPEIFTQMILSSTAFLIEHPEKAGDDGAVCAAGLEGALRAYEAILAREPECRRPELDSLAQRMREGTLSEYVTGKATRVGREPKGWRRFFSFQGRIRRKSFWLRVLALNVVALAALILASLVPTLVEANPELLMLPMLVFSIAALVFILATEVQRWHDLGYSGYMVLLNFIPILGGVASVIWLGFVKGESGANKYGSDPLAR